MIQTPFGDFDFLSLHTYNNVLCLGPSTVLFVEFALGIAPNLLFLDSATPFNKLYFQVSLMIVFYTKVSRSQGLKVSRSQGPKIPRSQDPKSPRPFDSSIHRKQSKRSISGRVLFKWQLLHHHYQVVQCSILLPAYESTSTSCVRHTTSPPVTVTVTVTVTDTVIVAARCCFCGCSGAASTILVLPPTTTLTVSPTLPIYQPTNLPTYLPKL